MSPLPTSASVLRLARSDDALNGPLLHTLTVLDELCVMSAARRSTISAVARKTGVSRPTVYHRLRTLEALGWLSDVKMGRGGLRVELAVPEDRWPKIGQSMTLDELDGLLARALAAPAPGARHRLAVSPEPAPTIGNALERLSASLKRVGAVLDQGNAALDHLIARRANSLAGGNP